MVLRRPHFNHESPLICPPQPNINRVEEVKVLGVSFTAKLSFEPHIDHVITRASQSMYALRILKEHGLRGHELFEVTRATVIASILYASPAWWGFASAGARDRLQSCVNKCKRRGFLPETAPDLRCLRAQQDNELFGRVLADPYHVLHRLLPPIKDTPYQLRPRKHNREIPKADTTQRKSFIMRLLTDYSPNTTTV